MDNGITKFIVPGVILTAGLMAGYIALYAPGYLSSSYYLGGLMFLVFFGSLVAFTAYSWLLKHYPPTLVATHTYVNPIVAVLLGWLFAGERISPSIVASTALAIAAIGLVQRGEDRGTERTGKATHHQG